MCGAPPNPKPLSLLCPFTRSSSMAGLPLFIARKAPTSQSRSRPGAYKMAALCVRATVLRLTPWCACCVDWTQLLLHRWLRCDQRHAHRPAALRARLLLRGREEIPLPARHIWHDEEADKPILLWVVPARVLLSSCVPCPAGMPVQYVLHRRLAGVLVVPHAATAGKR